MTTPTNDLRTDLARLLDEYAEGGPSGVVRDLRALLDAHPAPTMETLLDTRAGMLLANTAWQGGAATMLRSVNGHESGPWEYPENPYNAWRAHHVDADLGVLPAPAPVSEVGPCLPSLGESCGNCHRCTTPVSDVARAIDPEAFEDCPPGDWSPGDVIKHNREMRQRRALAIQAARRVLAALPAPPVVDEDVIAKVLAGFDSIPWANMRRETKDVYRSMAAAVAARLRGETRG
jgi:hypothetical protein